MREVVRPEEKGPTRPADPFSIIALAGGIGSLVFAVASVLPLVGMCTFPLSILCVLTSVVTSIISLVNTTMKPELEGRMQALFGLGLSLLWFVAAGLLFAFMSRTN